MATQQELVEAPLVEQQMDHTIRPRKVKKKGTTSLTLPKPTSELDAHNVTRNRDTEMVKNAMHEKVTGSKKKRKKMTEEHKQKIRETKWRKKMQKIENHDAREKDTKPKLGDNIMEIDEGSDDFKKDTPIVAKAPDVKDLHDYDSMDIVPLGTSMVHDDVVSSEDGGYRHMDLFTYLDDEFLHFVGIGHVEMLAETSAAREGSFFAPVSTVFNQHADYAEKATSEFSDPSKSYDLRRGVNTQAELAKYENMVDVRDRMEYIRASGQQADASRPLHPLEGQRPGPGARPVSFLRAAVGGDVQFRNTGGTVEY